MLKISINQAILILMDHYKNKPLQFNMLRKFYVSGLRTQEDGILLEEFLKEPALAEYKISIDYSVINEDPSRRYFETILAFETMKESLKELSIDNLDRHYSYLRELLSLTQRKEFYYVFSGAKIEDRESPEYEFSDAIMRINNDKQYKEFSNKDKYKLNRLIKIAYLGVFLCYEYPKFFPMNIYVSHKYFLPKNRGRVNKEDQKLVTSQHYGILKNYMPVPLDDIAYTEIPFSYPRITDRNTFCPEAKWTKHNFEKLVYPFVSSISGTLLAQLRCMLFLKEKNILIFNKKNSFCSFLQCFTSLLLYNSGGHSYYEYLVLLNLPEVRRKFKFIPEFKSINVESLLFQDNKIAFNSALQKTIEYNKIILNKMRLNYQIREMRLFFETHDEQKTHSNILPIKTNSSAIIKRDLKFAEIHNELNSQIMILQEQKTTMSLKKAEKLMQIYSKFSRLNLTNKKEIKHFSESYIQPAFDSNHTLNIFDPEKTFFISLVKTFFKKTNSGKLIDKIDNFLKEKYNETNQSSGPK